MPLFRRVLGTGGNQIVVATPAITGSTSVMFRVTTEDGRSCCCPTVDPTCDDLAWDYTIYSDLEFLMDNTVVPAVPPWSLVVESLNTHLDTSGEGVVIIGDDNGNVGLYNSFTRYSRFTATPSVRIDTQFNAARPVFNPLLSVVGGTDSVEVTLEYYKDGTVTFNPFATLKAVMEFPVPSFDTSELEWVLSMYLDGALIDQTSGTESPYRTELDPAGDGLYDASYYQLRLALVDDGTDATVYVNDVSLLTVSSTYIRADVDLSDCLVMASLYVGLETWTGDAPLTDPIFELWQFDVT